MNYYYSGQIRKQFKRELQKTRAQKSAIIRERLSTILTIIILLACYIAAGSIEKGF